MKFVARNLPWVPLFSFLYIKNFNYFLTFHIEMKFFKKQKQTSLFYYI